jgi:hypothetical protein
MDDGMVVLLVLLRRGASGLGTVAPGRKRDADMAYLVTSLNQDSGTRAHAFATLLEP